MLLVGSIQTDVRFRDRTSSSLSRELPTLNSVSESQRVSGEVPNQLAAVARTCRSCAGGAETVTVRAMRGDDVRMRARDAQ